MRLISSARSKSNSPLTKWSKMTVSMANSLTKWISTGAICAIYDRRSTRSRWSSSKYSRNSISDRASPSAVANDPYIRAATSR